MIRGLLVLAIPGLLLCACTDRAPVDDHGHDHGEGESWAVTAWGDQFEIFAEADPLVAGQASTSHTHVTFLNDFSAVTEGAVSAVLVGSDHSELVFRQDAILRAGIFNVTMTPPATGTFDLIWRVEAHGLTEDIPSGRVRVGSHDAPGGLLDAAAMAEAEHGEHAHAVDEPGHGHAAEAKPKPVVAATDAELISFLKEQQWKTPFHTVWSQQGEVHQVVSGTGRIRPVAGWETALTASLDGEVTALDWPYVGMTVESGTVVFRLAPRAGEGQSLAELEALETEKRAELELASERLSRLERLLEVQATSAAEVEAARARVTGLRAQHDAALRNLQAVRGTGKGSSGTRGRVDIVAPFAGQIADVSITPGQVVPAGATLARVVQTEPFWVEVYLHPSESALLGNEAQGLLLRGPGMPEPVRFDATQLRLVSRAPVVNDRTGTVTCIFEVKGTEPTLPLGTAVEADVLLSTTETGIVVPASAIVDDAGVPIVYVQVDGEGFARREVRLLSREGDRLLVDGLADGERLVTVGGATIRRATLVASDVGEGHVH